MRTTTEEAADIRARLKREHGWTSRDVSVRSHYFSLGSAIDVEIKTASIPRQAVEAIATRAERIARCSITGEILGGGNTYVSVCYSREAQEVHARRYADAVQRAVNAIPPGDDRHLEPVEGTDYLVGRPDQWRVTLWDREDGQVQQAANVDQIARTIGGLMTAGLGHEGGGNDA